MKEFTENLRKLKRHHKRFDIAGMLSQIFKNNGLWLTLIKKASISITIFRQKESKVKCYMKQINQICMNQHESNKMFGKQP